MATIVVLLLGAPLAGALTGLEPSDGKVVALGPLGLVLIAALSAALEIGVGIGTTAYITMYAAAFLAAKRFVRA